MAPYKSQLNRNVQFLIKQKGATIEVNSRL